MKQIKRIILLTVILSLTLSTLAYADPIGTIISSTPGSTAWPGLVTSASTTSGSSLFKAFTDPIDTAGGWIMNILNAIIGIIANITMLPLVMIFPTDLIAYTVFNYNPLTKLSFFDTDVAGSLAGSVSMAHSLMDGIAPIYVAFRYVAIICYIVIILYVAIRILLSTVSKEKAKYKEMLKYWLMGIIILLSYQWVMAYTIYLSDILVSIIASAVGYNPLSGALVDGIGSKFDLVKMGILMIPYFICLIGVTVAVLWTYLKRMFTVALLMLIFPLVTITYVFDKIGDRKSQILSAWTREFVTNVAIQPIQAIALSLIMIGFNVIDNGGLVAGLLGPILKLILLFMLFPAEKLVKKVFDVNPGINGGGFAGAGAGMIGGLMMAKSAIPVLKDNVSNFKNARNASAALTNAKRDFAKGKIDATKLAEAQKNAKTAKLRTMEAVTGTAGTLFGAGMTGSLSKGLGLGAVADLATGWGADKAGNKVAKNEITDIYDKLKSGVENGNLSDAQKKQIANRLGISTSELDKTLANAGGKDLVKKQLESEKQAALAHMRTGADAAQLERNKFKDSMKLDANGNFKELVNGSEVDAGRLGSLKVSRNNITALDENGNIKMNLLNADGKAFKHANFSDDKEVDYAFDISGPAGAVVLCDAQKAKAEESARKKTLESARLENASEAEQIQYLESPDGKKQLNRNYEAEVEKEVKIVEELREATGMQNLQVTNMTVTSASTPAPAPAPAPGTPAPAAPSGATIPQAAPVAAAPVNVDELTRAISSAFQSSMSSVANSMSTTMSTDLRMVVDELRNNARTMTPGSGANLDSDIRNILSGVSDDMARKLQTAADDYTKAVGDAQKSAANYLQQFGVSSKANDATTDLQIRYSEETSRKISEAKRKAGLDAI